MIWETLGLSLRVRYLAMRLGVGISRAPLPLYETLIHIRIVFYRLTEQRQSLQREKEGYRLEVMAGKVQIESLSEVLRKQDALLADKVSLCVSMHPCMYVFMYICVCVCQEQQLERRVQQSKEREWDKQMTLQQEKIDLEEKMSEMHR